MEVSMDLPIPGMTTNLHALQQSFKALQPCECFQELAANPCLPVSKTT